MADGVTMNLTGMDNLQKTLRTLEKKVERKIVRTAVRSGAKIIQAEAKAVAPYKTGILRRSISVRARKKRKKAEFSMNVLFDTRKYPQLVSFSVGSSSNLKTRKLTGKRYFYPAALEFGTTTRPNIKTKGWFRKAWDRRKQASLAVVLQSMKNGVEREAGKK